jgi:outer membrane biosynthesis protein TonB
MNRRPPNRRRALTVAITTHAALLGCVLILSEWQVEAVSPPETRPTFFIQVALPSSGDGETAAVKKSQPRPAPPIRSAPVTQLPAMPAQTKPEPATATATTGSTTGNTNPNTVGPVGPGGVIGAIDDLKSKQPPEPPDPPDPRVYKPGAIDVTPAQALDCKDPAYSLLARAMHLTGEVRLSAIIDLDGTAHDIRVLSGNPTLAQLAAESLTHCRFSPARLRDRPVRSEYYLTVTFRLG